MKILFINFDKRWGGGQEYLLKLIDGLLNNGYEIGQLIPPKSLSAERFPKEFSNNHKYKSYTVNRISDLFKILQIFSQYQIIHIHREHDLWLGLIVSLISKIFHPQIKLVFSQHIKPTKKRFALKFFDLIICNSLYTKSVFQDIYSDLAISELTEQKLQVVYPSVSIENNEILDSGIKLSGNPKLLMSGAYYKGQDELIEIFEEIITKLPEAKLYFIGPSEEESQVIRIKELIFTKGLDQQVYLLPQKNRNEYLSILQQVDIFLCVFKYDGFGMAALEAALMGKLIVAYKAGGVIEILKNYEYAKLIEIGNKEAYVQSILEFNDLIHAKEILVSDSNKSVEKLLAKFSLSQLIQGHIDLYSDMLK